MPALFVKIAAFLGLMVAANAAPGDLDGSFGARGRVLISFPLPSFAEPGSDGASAAMVLVQSDGKIVSAGGGGIFCARQHPDGSLDSSFAEGGKLAYHTGLEPALKGMVQQSDGKMVLGGCMHGSGLVMLLRVGLDGVLDPAFGSNGTVVIPGFGHVIAMAGQSDDKIVVVGSDLDRSVFFIARVNANGQLDTGFGNQGTASVSFDNSDAWASSVKIRADGKIVVGGTSDGSFALARLQPNGSLDGTFGQDGKTMIVSDGDWSECLCLAIREGGKIVLGGVTSLDGASRFYPGWLF